MLILWLKAFHIIFLVCWFAGIFYLPRLFVNHAMTDNLESRKLLLLMEKKTLSVYYTVRLSNNNFWFNTNLLKS